MCIIFSSLILYVNSIRVFCLTGFNIKTSSAKKEAKSLRQVIKRREESDEDDTEWIPGCEEIGKKRRSKI